MQSRLFAAVVGILSLFVLFVPIVSAATFKVVKVESWDTLNVRSGPGTKNGVLFELPHNATHIKSLGERQTVGRTPWVKVSWQGKQGWVSQHYLAEQAAAQNTVQTRQPEQPVQLMVSPEPDSQPAPAEQAKADTPIIKRKQSGMWILECGSARPFWKVEVLPEWMRGTLGEHKTGMPITNKRQEHGKYRNVALETELRGSNKWNRLRLTLNYTKSCYSSLTKRREAFKVKGMFNNESIEGCCRALKVK